MICSLSDSSETSDTSSKSPLLEIYFDDNCRLEFSWLS